VLTEPEQFGLSSDEAAGREVQLPAAVKKVAAFSHEVAPLGLARH
jgi:hypothetical protein